MVLTVPAPEHLVAYVMTSGIRGGAEGDRSSSRIRAPVSHKLRGCAAAQADMAVSGGSTKGWTRLDSQPHKIPAWKLEVLERKRAKMASAAASRGKDSSPSRRTRSPSRQGSPERLVLQDSLGPLHENPFIKQEKERRRHRRPQQRQHSPGRAASPIRHLLDMYSHVPGMRTIRAENIIIIESDPDYFSHPSSHGDPVEELLAKRGSKVAEIRASEVIIYEPEVPDKEPPKKLPEPPMQEEPEHSEVLEEAGRVSRLLEKFDHGHSKPVRTRSLENLLERDSKPIILPKPPFLERQGQAPRNKSPPRRSGSVSPSSTSILEEDSKRFPLNNPSWLPSKVPISPSLPDPDLFYKRPSSPMTSPVTIAPLSPSSPQSPRYETSTGDKSMPPIVAAVRERFEGGHSTNNVPPLPKLVNVTQKVGSNTILVNPKAVPTNKVKSPTTDEGGVEVDGPPLTNGHVDHLEKSVNKSSSVSIQDLLSKSKRPKGTTTAQRAPEGNGPVPSNDPLEIPNGANTWRPKSEVVSPKSSSFPSKPSATYPDNPSITNHCDQAFTSATPSQRLKVSASTSSNDSFEIRPAPKPDLSSIPDDDVQARALANIRMQSKNSFVFIPKKRPVPSVTQQDGMVQAENKPKVKISASTLNGPKFDSMDSPRKYGVRDDVRVPSTPQEVRVNGDASLGKAGTSETLKASTVPSLSDFDWKSGLLPARSATEGQSFTDLGAELEYFSSVQEDGSDLVIRVPVTKIPEDAMKADIPVTNIDDIVTIEDKEVHRETKPIVKVEESSYRPHAAVSSIRNKGGNTFTVVPKRKPVTEQEAFRTPVVEDEEEDDPRSKRKSSDGAEAPYTELGALLKKRYPTADEIQVIGGYQSLSKSCLTKIGSTRKKMKISFNEQRIHTMFEYPSENSLAEDMAEEEVKEVSGSESEEDDRPSGLFLPRPTFMSGSATSNSLRANSANSGLSNYTPKHSMEYSKWQDEASLGGSTTLDLNSPSEDMLTPADGNSHMGFRSEPALYF
ncbi:taperin [Dendropsophus ebraccatus]|uniref:taperin n=1 Tax=Dendropsophus ebraccatus TaxID=150705 RepID=UPI0038319D40